VSTSAIFPHARARTGMYESFFLRAVAPQEPLGVWIRYTVEKPRGGPASGSLWCTVFDSREGAPFMHRVSEQELRIPPGGWIEVDGAGLTPATAQGACGQARWELRFSSEEPELRHLPREWLYRMPLPRTKLTSPLPAARFDGALELPGRAPIELDGWRGMVGHNWGAAHADRWLWLHGVGFGEDPRAWIDVALGRVKLAGRMTPWVASGMLSLGGRRHRIGGLGARGLRVQESAEGCQLELPGEGGLSLTARARVPRDAAAHWRYSAAGSSGERDVINCSVSALELSVALAGEHAPRLLSSAHGGAYELGGPPA
jgi:hypothetical protein